MNKRAAKSQASSARAAATAFGAFGAPSLAFGTSSSPLSHVSEPPNLSAISDPNVVVYFRNLSKRDSTTKAKALEDIQGYVSSLQEPVEEGILEAWIKIYPRTSMENAKAVRQNAHLAHGAVAVSAGKRVAKHMPKSVAAWLCGLYDSDRSVVEATQNSLRQVFNTPEKIQSIRKAYQQPILDFCKNAIDKETAATLSDTRVVSPDDAEAKYSRVISACISLLGSLLANLQPDELAKNQSDYDTLMGDKKLWDFASCQDASIRRAVHRFLKICLAKQPIAIEAGLEPISKAYLSNGLNSDQIGSIYDFAEALTLLTSAHPSVWTKQYKSKTSVEKRLRQFLKKGSQIGPREYWAQLLRLINLLPVDILPKTHPDTVEFLTALHSGIVRKDESKANQEAALKTYLEVVDLLHPQSNQDDWTRILEEMVLPLISQYLLPSLETSQWSTPVNAKGLRIMVLKTTGMNVLVAERWPHFAQQLVDDIKTSAPEQSKDYDTSQTSVIQHATRFATLQGIIINDSGMSNMEPALASACSMIIMEAINIIKNRNGKPYGAAGAAASLLQHRGSGLTLSSDCKENLQNFVCEDLPGLLTSRSSTYLVDILYSTSDAPTFAESWRNSLEAILQGPNSSSKTRALEAILTSARIPTSFDLATADSELQAYIIANIRDAVEGLGEWDFFNRMLQSHATILSPETTAIILTYMTESLSISQRAPYSLQGMRQVVRSNPSILRHFLTTPEGSKLLQALLLASESPNDEIAQGAAAVSSSVQTIMSSESDTTHSVYNLIQQGLREASPMSVSIETLVDLAKQSIKTGSDWDDLRKVLPSIQDWNSALLPFLDAAPKSSLAITNPLGGALYLVESSGASAIIESMARDADGYSSAYRITQYITKLFKSPDLFSINKVPAEVQAAFLRNVALTIQLADDNLGLARANGLWADYGPDVEADAINFMSDAQSFVAQELKRLAATSWSNGDSESSLATWAVELLAEIDAGNSPHAYYQGRIYGILVADAIEIAGWMNSHTPQLQEILKTVRKSKQFFALVGFLNAFKEPLTASRACERMCNELVADLTGLDIEQKPSEGLCQLVLLNAVLSQDCIVQSIAKQRLVFFVKHVVPWLQGETIARPILAELCRALIVLLPSMSDMYGDHWIDILNALAKSWSKTHDVDDSNTSKDSTIPYIHASLKLYAQIRTLTQADEPNDDLVDAWKDTKQAIANGLINVLKNSQHFPDDFHQPLKMVNDVLARQISKVSLDNLESTEELYPLLYVESQPVQQTAFGILHKQIAVAQEQISIDAALEKSTARLPEELLSLILDAPTVAALAEANFERSVPLPLRGYLLSWLLVFDHLEHASFKVKNDYVEHVKEGDYLPGLLTFTFDFLGHAHNKPVDVSKLDVTTYEPDLEPPKRDLQWLLTHTYFLCLCHLPSLTKAWFKECKSRATVVTLEPWTEKFISPPVIAAALESVTTWSERQAAEDSDSPFSVKVAPRAREITASYMVDEQTMSMRISLPPAFPLANAHIEGLNRVAVNEQKWQSWLRTSLGAITIFNGSLIDALSTFRRNVDGALKGQSECAICYSIVGSDRKLPDKKCQTCKNLFHGICLFKWFKTSGSSSCPLCRNPFNYG